MDSNLKYSALRVPPKNKFKFAHEVPECLLQFFKGVGVGKIDIF